MTHKTILGCFIIFISYTSSFGQKLEFQANLGLASGLEYAYNDYTYSPGSGLLIEAGVGYQLTERFLPYFRLGYQTTLQMESESSYSSSGSTSTSSFTMFNRGMVIAGINYLGYWSDKKFRGLILGAGLNYNIPGKLKMSYDDIAFGDISYGNTLGWHTELLAALDFGERLSLRPGIRYRDVRFYATEYANGQVIRLPTDLKRLNAFSIDIVANLAIKIGR